MLDTIDPFRSEVNMLKKLPLAITSFVLLCLLSTLILIWPISTVLTHENTKETFHTIKLYDRLVTIISSQWMAFNPIENPDDQLFESLIQDNATDIISADWVGVVGDQFIDEFFYSMKYDDAFTNFTVDLSPVKRNFISVLRQSDISNEIPKIESQIPDTIPISLLFGVDVRQINYLILEFEQVLTMFYYLRYILLVLLAGPFVVFVLIGKINDSMNWIMGTFLAVSLPYLVFPFVFKLFLISESGLYWLTNGYASFRETISVLVALSFVEQMMHTWTIVALTLFGMSLGYFVWKRLYQHD